MNFALNHMVAPRLSARKLIDLAAALGCIGVELRNDLSDKGLTDSPFFDGEPPETIAAYAQSKNIRILGLSEVYGFNDWSAQIEQKVEALLTQAIACGAESISLIPLNDGRRAAAESQDMLRNALAQILPKLKQAAHTALVEPLGFPTSSLSMKADAIAAIDALGGNDYFSLVHDTFHHTLAGETQFFPQRTGIVHISGVVNEKLAFDQMQDADRILVDERDRLGNIDQITALLDGGYAGVFSFEPFSADVHGLDNVEAALRESMGYLRGAAAR